MHPTKPKHVATHDEIALRKVTRSSEKQDPRDSQEIKHKPNDPRCVDNNKLMQEDKGMQEFFKVNAVLRGTIAAFCLALLGKTAIGQSIPPIRQGDQYSTARSMMINSGWQMETPYPPVACIYRFPNKGIWYQACKKYPEFEVMSVGGTWHFNWRNAEGRTLVITTGGRSEPYEVKGWYFAK